MKSRTYTVNDKDIKSALSVLRGEMSLAMLRAERGLTTSSCYSYTLRCLQEAYTSGRLIVK